MHFENEIYAITNSGNSVDWVLCEIIEGASKEL